MSEPKFPSLPDDLTRLNLNGRATESQFAQNPLPVVEAMGYGLAAVHLAPVPDGLAGRTATEAAAVREYLDTGATPPSPFARVSAAALLEMLDNPPEASARVLTHGAPIVDAAVLASSAATFDSAGAEGFDPPERDLAIIIRSISETFTSEVSRTFLEAYRSGGGTAPSGPALDWYALLAAFR